MTTTTIPIPRFFLPTLFHPKTLIFIQSSRLTEIIYPTVAVFEGFCFMGTLFTSCTFSTGSPRARLRSSFPHSRGALRERAQLLEDRDSLKSFCFSCSGKSWKVIMSRNFDKLKCYSFNNDDDGDDKNMPKDLNLTVASPDEAEQKRGAGGAESDSENTPAAISPRPSSVSPTGLSYNNFQVDSFKLMELLGPEKVDPVDVKIIKDRLFGYSTFWVTGEEPFGDLGEGILFLGNLRGKREEVFDKLQSQLTEVMGDKYNLFMVEEPNSEGPDPRGGPRVSFGMLRREVYQPGPTTLWQYVIAFLLFLLTIGSSVELGIATQINRLPPEVVKYFTDPDAIEQPDMQLLFPYLESALPLAYGVLGVQFFHEVGHFVAAFPKKVKLSIPYFIPNITLGSFGSITQFKSILPDRKTKVDVSFSGPFAGASLSFLMFFGGLLLSSNPDGAGDLVHVPSTLFQGSLLLGLISRVTLGYTAMHAATIPVHPLVIAGWCGLTTSAFNMLPVGSLDGGRAVQLQQGAFGKDALFGSGLTTYMLLGLGVLGGPLSLPWALYVLLCQRTPEKPCLNDVTDVGTLRRTIVLVAISAVVLVLLPVWDELAEELGIGLVTTF